MTEFTPGQPANIAHRAIVSSLKTQKNAERCSLLWFAEIIKRKLYRELGFSSIKHYAMSKLGFSKSQFYVFYNLCLKLEELPCMKEKIESGELDYTKAQALLPVVDKTNEKEWVNKAKGRSRRELQGIVKEAKKEAQKLAADEKSAQPSLIDIPRKQPVAVVPVVVSMKMSPTQFARYEALWEKVWKRRSASWDMVEAMLEMMESYVMTEPDVTDPVMADSRIPDFDTPDSSVADSVTPTHRAKSVDSTHNNAFKKSSRLDSACFNKPPVHIHIHKCPDCKAATIQTSKGELKISEAEYEQALCDCTISQPNKRNSASIPPSIRQKVMERARYKCQRPGCDHTRFLEVHHIIPRSQGGTNDVSNLTCLCSACHRLVHETQSRNTNILVRELPSSYLFQTTSPNNLYNTGKCLVQWRHQLTQVTPPMYIYTEV